MASAVREKRPGEASSILASFRDALISADEANIAKAAAAAAVANTQRAPVFGFLRRMLERLRSW